MCPCCRYGIVALLGLAALVTSYLVQADEKTGPRTDQYAGKTVKDSKAGMGLIRARAKNVPKVGQPAPDFSLQTLDGKQTIRLSQYRGKKPVVLVFGSYT